ncbi:MAG: histidinol-phosphatase [Desulforhopalus sp.]
MANAPSYVSVHGGHSGQFCNHAVNSLEEIIQCYIANRFVWVGITEHSPPIRDELLYPDQRDAGLTAEVLLEQFGEYMKECRRLQQKYHSKLSIFAAMEIETYRGYKDFVPYLLERFRPDYIVGSVHFVNDIGFDYSREQYQKAVAAAGDLNTLYCQYFDAQYEMISLFKPAVVGHFDLVRIFDNDYKTRLSHPAIRDRISRNLQLIKELDLIMDYNLRSLLKGADEPYISAPILEMALKMGISVVPGDDSHGLSSIGVNMAKAVRTLNDLGFDTNWNRPRLLQYS